MNPEKLERLRKSEGSVRTGGKGSVRRKRKAVHKGPRMDDKQIQSTIQKVGVQDIPGIEQVNMFKDDSNVINFTNPKVQANVGANTFVISGNGETKSIGDLLTKDPDILSQMGVGHVDSLKKIAESLKNAGAAGAGAGEAAPVEEDDAMPALEENFDDAAQKDEASTVESID